MNFRSIALFWLAIFVVVVAFSAVSVYRFDHFESNWGKAISFQVLLLIAVVEATVGALGFAVGTKIFGATARKLRVFVVGIAVGVVFLLFQMFLGETLISTTSSRQIFTALTIFGLSLLAALLFRHRQQDDIDA